MKFKKRIEKCFENELVNEMENQWIKIELKNELELI